MYNVKFVVPFNLIKKDFGLISIYFKLTFSRISSISLLFPLSFGFTVGFANDFGKLGINRVSYIYLPSLQALYTHAVDALYGMVLCACTHSVFLSL